MSHSSVPQGDFSQFNKGVAIGGGTGKHVDSIVMYCSYFTYGPDQALNRRMLTENIRVESIIATI